MGVGKGNARETASGRKTRNTAHGKNAMHERKRYLIVSELVDGAAPLCRSSSLRFLHVVFTMLACLLPAIWIHSGCAIDLNILAET